MYGGLGVTIKQLAGDSHWRLHKETQMGCRDAGNSVSSSDRWKDLAGAEELFDFNRVQQPFQQKEKRSLTHTNTSYNYRYFLLALHSYCYSLLGPRNILLSTVWTLYISEFLWDHTWHRSGCPVKSTFLALEIPNVWRFHHDNNNNNTVFKNHWH